MEVVDIQEQARKYPRLWNGETKNGGRIFDGGEAADEGVARINGELYNWQNSSRIIRASRASGGKDRHSKVWTSKGLRDRRVRLSVSTAIQLYDLQDRLGYDQPSKAVDWLMRTASYAISDLPKLNASFPATPTQFTSEKKRPTEMKVDADITIRQKSACCSPSENSKGSAGLSLRQSKTRPKTKDRTEKNDDRKVTHLSISPSTELLTGGFERFPGDLARVDSDDEHSFFLPSTAVKYFSQAITASGCSAQIRHLPPTVATPSNENQAEMQHFGGHLIPNSDEDNLDFNVSSIVSAGWGNIPAGFNRGTLQSNSPPKFASIDVQNLPFLVGAPSTSVFSRLTPN